MPAQSCPWRGSLFLVMSPRAFPVTEAPPSRPHLNLIASHRPRLQIPSHWGPGLQHPSPGGRAQPMAGNAVVMTSSGVRRFSFH